jgi:hypoxanthine phosphoribosyltransferase
MAAAYEPYLQEVLYDEAAIQQRVRELGAQISSDYADKKNLILICILKGGVMFMTDLMRHIEVPHEIDFLAVSSYLNEAREPTGDVKIIMDLAGSIAGKHVLIVEDIIDSGYTLRYVIYNMLAPRNPASIKLCTMLDKPSRRKVDIVVDYVGFAIENKFVFGYGLDLDGVFRNLPFVGVVKPGMTWHGG